LCVKEPVQRLVAAVRPPRRGPDGLPLPPPYLIHAVTGREDEALFLESGRREARAITAALARQGVDVGRLGAVLDFGCGCGRILRHFAGVRGPAWHGTDYDPELLGWARQHLPFATFQVNAFLGRLAFPDATFDLVYMFSVFTHLTEAQQLHWMAELTRVIVPGGHLYLALSGEKFLSLVAPTRLEEFRAGQLVVVWPEHAGRNVCGTYHPESYVRRTLARGLKVVDFVPSPDVKHLDAYLLRKPRG